MRLSRALPIACAFAALAGALGAEEVTPPVPIRTPTPLVPVATEGSGLTPEASVRVRIDERGVVVEVEVLSIEPSSEFDDLYRGSLVDTLSSWRYAPQRRDGVAEPTTLAWKVHFPERTPRSVNQSVNPEIQALPIDTLPGADAELRRSAILALPEKQRLLMLQNELKIARGLLDARYARTAERNLVVVHCDSDNEKAAELIAGNVEAMLTILAKRLLPQIVLLPEHHKLQVVAYRSRDEYSALVAQMQVYEWSSGYYSPAGLIAFHLDQGSNDELINVMLHETTHAFLDRYVVRRGVALPRWLGEGFADYIGNSAIRKGQLVPGKTLHRKYELHGGTVQRVDTSGGQEIEEARRALAAGKGLGVARLLAASAETFYGEDRHLYYATAWLFVHFLRDGAEGWSETRFPAAMTYIAEGYPPATVVRDLYGSSDALDASFRSYVVKF